MSPDLRCDQCGAHTPSMAPESWRCRCGQPWWLPPGPAFDPLAIVADAGGVWRYRRQIRLPEGCALPTLGEGAGGWVHLPQGPTIACAHIEPTLSFKDRGVAVMVAWAIAAGVPVPLIEDSSGNAGGALAAYAAAAGLPCRIYVPRSAPAAKKATLVAFGAEVVEIDGPRVRASEAAQADTDGTYLSHAWNPFFLEGTKTLAFQWWELHRHELPRRVFVPAGQGSLIIGLSFGFEELCAAFPDLRPPDLIAVQHRTAAPLWKATGADGEAPAIEPGDEPSIADGIAIEDPVRGEALAEAITGSGGRVVVVGNDEVRAARRELCRHGIWAEPTGAVAYAGHRRIGGDPGDLVVVTGHGLKAVG